MLEFLLNILIGFIFGITTTLFAISFYYLNTVNIDSICRRENRKTHKTNLKKTIRETNKMIKFIAKDRGHLISNYYIGYDKLVEKVGINNINKFIYYYLLRGFEVYTDENTNILYISWEVKK